jgi:hypothetical protein
VDCPPTFTMYEFDASVNGALVIKGHSRSFSLFMSNFHGSCIKFWLLPQIYIVNTKESPIRCEDRHTRV